MFDRQTSGEVPEHRDFIYNRLKPFCEKELGIPFTVLRAGKTYEDVFHHIIVRGPHQGEKRGFVWPGMCAVNRDCKVPPIKKYNASLSPETVSYVGIAADEPVRLARLAGTNKVSLLDKCALPGFVDSKNEEKTERNAGYLVVSQSGGGMLRQGTRKGIRRTPANRGMRAHRIVKSLDISEDVCHGMCP